MRAVAVIGLTMLLAAGAVAEDAAAPTPLPPHAPRQGIPRPKVEEGWGVIVCAVFNTASSVSISAAPAGQELQPIGEWTRKNNATKWVLPGAMAETERITVQVKAAPADTKGSACVMYRRIPRYHFDFSGEAQVTVGMNDPYARCPCARGLSLDEKL